MKKLYLKRDRRDIHIYYNDAIRSLWQGESYIFKIEQFEPLRQTKFKYDKYEFFLRVWNILAWQIVKGQ